MAHAPEPTMNLPLSLEPVLGWRVWRLQRHEGRLVLLSATRHDPWPAGEVFQASCWIDHGSDGAPHRECRCGAYAASSPQTLAAANVVSPETCVVGTVAMWGSVVEHARGARSRFAYPARLALVCSRCLVAGSGARTPSRVREWDDVVSAGCEGHTGGFLTTKAASDVQQELLSTYVVDPLPVEMLAYGFTPRRRDVGETLLWAGRTLASSVFGGSATGVAVVRSRHR